MYLQSVLDSAVVLFLVVVACVDVLAVTEVTGHVGEDVSFHCSGNWTSENSSEHLNMFFCKGICSREKTVIQSPGATAAVVRMGRYSLQPIRGGGAFKVNITELKMADTGRYYCGVGNTVIVLYQEVNLKVQNDGTSAVRMKSVQVERSLDVSVLPCKTIITHEAFHRKEVPSTGNMGRKNNVVVLLVIL